MIRVITVAYKNSSIVDALLTSLQKHLVIPHEIVIWNNSADQKNFDTTTHAQNIFIIDSPTNTGFACGVNEATRFKTPNTFSHILLINPDALLASDFTEEVLQKLIVQKGIIGFRVFSDEKKSLRQQSARSFPHWLTAISGREGILSRMFPRNPLSAKYLRADLDFMKTDDPPSPVDWVSGCALFCARETWEELGGFDERFFLYVEDVDLGRQAAKLNIPELYYPIVDVIHHSRTTSKSNPWKSDFYHHSGMFKYWWKWASRLERVFFVIPLLGIGVRYLFRRVLGDRGRTST
jgi:GT2 family glycosyltransferase